MLALAAELGYAPPLGLRIRENTAKMIGIFIQLPHSQIHDSSHGYLTAISKECARANLIPVYHQMDYIEMEDVLNPEKQPVALKNGQLSGIILIHRWPVEIIKKIRTKVPIVSIMHDYDLEDIDLVTANNLAGIKAIIQELHDLGHRNIGFIGKCADLSWAMRRLAGYAEGLLHNNCSIDDESIISVPVDLLEDPRRDWNPLIDTILSVIKERKLTSLVCCNDHAASKIYSILRQADYRVPEDISLTGFDKKNVMPDGLILTTQIIPDHAMGAAAVQFLLRRLEDKKVPSHTILLDCEFISGNTIAAAPAKNQNQSS